MKSYTDFMLALTPPEQVQQVIRQYKQQATDIMGTDEHIHSVPRIIIKNLPRQKNFITEPAIASLKTKLMAMAPIALALDGLDYFSHSQDYKTIYAKITIDAAQNQWFKEIKKHLNIRDYLMPHIILCNNITGDAFNKLWPHFKNAPCAGCFEVKSLTVLSKEAFAAFATWETYAEIPFKLKHTAPKGSIRAATSANKKQHQTINQQISLF